MIGPETLKVLVVETDGTCTAKRIPATLGALQSEVGGFIEALGLTSDVSCYLNEEGKLTGMVFNPVADVVIRTLLQEGDRRLSADDHIVGPVVFLGPPVGEEGWDSDVPERLLDWFRNSRNDLIRYREVDDG